MKETRCALQSLDPSRPEEPDELHRLCPVDAIVRCAGVGGVLTELGSLATTAYVWGSALVASTRVRQNMTRPDDPFAVRPASSPGAPLNNVGHQRQLSDPQLTVGVAPNVDTLYSMAWLDLEQAPFVLETPNFGDRYYSFQIGYADTECDVCPGLRTHGPQLPPLFLHGPAYRGPVPEAMLPVASRTRYVMIGGRILVEPEDPGDVTRVHRLQEQITLRTLSRWESEADGPNPVSAQRRPPTIAEVGDADLVFLHQLGAVLTEGAVTTAERELVTSFAPLGLHASRAFDPQAIGDADRATVIAGLRDGEAAVEEKIGHLGLAGNGWSVNLRGSRFGDDHLLRAAVAKNQIYVVPAEEAVYPVTRVDGNGDRLDGRNRYRLVLDSPPPADAFWSLTVYGIPGPLIANPLDRYAIGDRTPGLASGDDGAVTILLQHDEPAEGTSNWLPVPAGPFHLMMRLYWPQPPVLEGRWMPPPVKRVHGGTVPRSLTP